MAIIPRGEHIIRPITPYPYKMLADDAFLQAERKLILKELAVALFGWFI